MNAMTPTHGSLPLYRQTRLFLPAWLLLATLVVTGCDSGPAVYPIHGKLTASSGDPSLLAGHSIEIVSRENNQIRSFGSINPDGTFEIESLIEGKLVKGALPGDYAGRVVFTDDDPAQRHQAMQLVPSKYLNIDSSNLSLKVPSDSAIEWNLVP